MAASCVASFVNFDKFSELHWNGSTRLRYTIKIYVQKLAQVTKSNTKESTS